MATESVPLQQLDITKCAICNEVCSDPRQLPCIHTYCLKCLAGWVGDKGNVGHLLACPQCSTKFNLPESGCDDLPRNRFVERLLEVRKLCSPRTSRDTSCDVCSSDEASEKGASAARRATLYCVDCQQNYCEQCSLYHKRMKSSASHQYIELGQELSAERLLAKLPPAACKHHENKNIEAYCLDCSVAVCVMCCLKTHHTHKCSDVKDLASKFQQQISCDVTNVVNNITKCREMLHELNTNKDDLNRQVDEAKDRICKTAEKLKVIIEQHKQRLVDELSAEQQRRAKELETVRQRLEQHLAALNVFKAYCGELKENGTAVDIAEAVGGLHDRANELMECDSTTHAGHSHKCMDIGFRSSGLVMDSPSDTVNIVGNIVYEELTFSWPILSHVIRGGYGAGGPKGVTSLGNEVFVVRTISEIEVYDCENLKLQRRLSVPGLSPEVHGLTSCAANKCLYVTDYAKHIVYKVRLSGDNEVTKWKVAIQPRGLSVNEAHNVLVVSGHNCCVIQEFTTHGTIVREIKLQSSITQPWHCLQLSDGNYLVAHRTATDSVCVVGLNGRYVGTRGQKREITEPRCLAASNRDYVFVADNSKLDTIYVYDHSLSRILRLPLPGVGLVAPQALNFDASRNRLYVAERKGRVLAFDNVKVKFS